MNRLVPLANRLILRRHEATEMIGSIIIPDLAKEAPLEAEIVAVGPDVKSKEQLKVGSKCLIGKYSGQEVNHEGESLVLLREDEILASIVEYETGVDSGA